MPLDQEQARAHAALRDSAATKADIVATRSYLDTALARLESRLTLRVGTMIAAWVVILIAVKFFG